MDTLRAAESPECNQGIYEALLVSYDTFAAEQPFYRLWDSGAVMYPPVQKLWPRRGRRHAYLLGYYHTGIIWTRRTSASPR